MVHQTKQIRTYFFLKVRSDFLFVMKSPVSAMVYSASGWRCCEWDKVHKESKRFPALFKRHILTTFFLSSLENLFFLDIQNAPFSAFSAFFTVRFEGSISISVQGSAFCICDREEYGRVTRVSIREIRFPNTHIRLAFRGFTWLFICGRAPRWLDILSPFGSRYRMIREGLLGGKLAIGHRFKIRISTSVFPIARSV